MRWNLLLMFVGLSSSLYGQDDTAATRPVQRISIPAVPGLPFTGLETIARTDSAGAGAISTRNRVARDGEGRVYRQFHRLSVGAGGDLMSTSILDPVSGTASTCMAETSVCVVRPLPRTADAGAGSSPIRNTGHGVNGEALGTRKIDGLEAVGTRETLSGSGGSPDPGGEIVREFWFSPALRVDLEIVRRDPRGGTQTASLKILDRSAPDPGLFSRPANYVVREATPPNLAGTSGAGVRPPVVVSQADPQFSEEARREKKGGSVLVGLVVDENGSPTKVHVVRGVGLGLDQKAVEAVEQYRFRPAMKDGQPVSMPLNIVVNFQIFGRQQP